MFKGHYFLVRYRCHVSPVGTDYNDELISNEYIGIIKFEKLF